MKTSKNKGISKTKSKIKKSVVGWYLLLPSIILFVVIVWRPIIIGILYSFFKLRGFEPIKFVGISNYVKILGDTNFIKTFFNTLQYVFWSLVIGFPLPFFTAVMLNEMIHAKSFFKITSYIPVIVPGMAVYLVWKLIYGEGDGGVLNIILAKFGCDPVVWLASPGKVIPLIIIMMSWHGFGSTVIMYLASLQGINQELYEAARLDGMGFFSRLKNVLFPHMWGIMLLLGVRQIIGVFSVTEAPLVMTDGGPNGASTSLGLLNWKYAFQFGQYDKSLALGVVTFVMLLSLTILYNRLDKKIND